MQFKRGAEKGLALALTQRPSAKEKDWEEQDIGCISKLPENPLGAALLGVFRRALSLLAFSLALTLEPGVMPWAPLASDVCLTGTDLRGGAAKPCGAALEKAKP